jgi:hypothetical protein
VLDYRVGEVRVSKSGGSRWGSHPEPGFSRVKDLASVFSDLLTCTNAARKILHGLKAAQDDTIAQITVRMTSPKKQRSG